MEYATTTAKLAVLLSGRRVSLGKTKLPGKYRFSVRQISSESH